MYEYNGSLLFYINTFFNQPIGVDILCLLLAVAGALAVYLRFLAPKGERPYKDFGDWLHDFLDFKAMLLEPLLKILYLFSALYVTALSLYLLFDAFESSGWWMPLVGIIVGNVALRVAYEFLMLIVRFFSNISDINRKLKG